MKRSIKMIVAGISIVGLVVLFSVAAFGSTIQVAAATQMTIIGTVNEDYQIVTDTGEVYDVNEGETADEMLQLIGKRVEVTGQVEDEDELRRITVESYQELDQ